MTLVLPIELYRPIVECFDNHERRTLLSLMLTSRQWNVEAERVLYTNFDNVQSGATQTRFLQRIIACPRVGALVTIYKVNMNFPLKPPESAAIISLVTKALPCMPNLRSFSFRTLGGQPAAHILSSCTFQLQEFNWGCHADEKDLMPFLASQNSLKHLTIDSWDAGKYGKPAIAPDITPNIISLSGRYGTIAAFLPGRHIVSVDWVPDLDDPEPDGTLLGDALRHIRTLTFGGYFMRPDLSSIAKFLSNLRYLELRGIQADDLECISLIPRLETLKISMQWVQDIPIPVSSHRDVALKLFQECLYLRKITMASRKHNHWASDYKQWSRPSNSQMSQLKLDMLPCTDIPFDNT